MDFPYPPAPNEIEVTLFGPGYGESIVLHLGNNSWAIVDSCVAPDTGKPVALEYLAALGIDPSQVCFVAVSHWHDDHVKGLAEVFAACSRARLVLASALRSDEFKSFAASYQDSNETRSPGTSEISRVLFQAAARTAKNQPHPLLWASSDRLVFRSNVEQIEVAVYALSPSDADFTCALNRFAQNVPVRNSSINRAVDARPNQVAIAMHVQIGNDGVLLGSDLEVHGGQNHGWEAVFSTPSRPFGSATLYKVAHHGSDTGEHPRIWSDLLAARPVSTLTQFRRSALPTEVDKARVTANSSAAYITSDGSGRAELRGHALAVLRRRTRSFMPATGRLGTVRARKQIGQATSWRVETFGAARRIG